jgi:hypothetical protein
VKIGLLNRAVMGIVPYKFDANIKFRPYAQSSIHHEYLTLDFSGKTDTNVYCASHICIPLSSGPEPTALYNLLSYDTQNSLNISPDMICISPSQPYKSSSPLSLFC